MLRSTSFTTPPVRLRAASRKRRSFSRSELSDLETRRVSNWLGEVCVARVPALAVDNEVITTLKQHLGLLPGDFQIRNRGVTFFRPPYCPGRLGDEVPVPLASHFNKERRLAGL